MTDQFTDNLRRRIDRSVRSHYRAANLFRDLDRVATVFSVIANVVLVFVGVYFYSHGQFAGALKDFIEETLLWFGLVVLLVSLLQVALNWGRRSDHHKEIAVRYAALRRKLDLKLRSGDLSEADGESIVGELDALAERADIVPSWIWNRDKQATLAPSGDSER